MSQHCTGPREGRTFFVILTSLVGIGVLMTVISVGLLVVAALTL